MSDRKHQEPPDTLTLAEAAKRLGKSVKATKAAIERGDLPGIPWGRSYLIPRDRFEQMLRGEPQGPP